MEDPKNEITDVILNLTTTTSPDVQRETVLRFMTSDVSFEHPVCSVRSRPNSRDAVLRVYQWYRILSPQVDLKVDHVVFDKDRDVMYVEIMQWFKLFFLPVRPLPARLVTRLELRKVKNFYYICRQDDFYHTIDFTRLVLPPLAPVVDFLLVFGALFTYLAACISQRMGFWRPTYCSKGEAGSYPGDKEDLYSEPIYLGTGSRRSSSSTLPTIPE